MKSAPPRRQVAVRPSRGRPPSEMQWSYPSAAVAHSRQKDTSAAPSALLPTQQQQQLEDDLARALPNSSMGAKSLSQLCEGPSLTAAIFTHIISPLLGASRTKNQFDVQVKAARVLLPLSRRRAAVAEAAAAVAAPSDDSSAADSLSAPVSDLSLSSRGAAARCDADSLSVIFSFLSASEFVSAISACRIWYSIRLRPRSWPLFQKILSLQEAAQLVFSSDRKGQLAGLRFLRKSVSVERNPPVSEVQSIEGFTQRVMELARKSKEDAAVLFEIGWLLTNESSGSTVHARHVVDHGGIEIFKEMLQHEDIEVADQAAQGLGNIAGDSTGMRDRVLKEETLPLLLQLCERDLPDVKDETKKRNAIWAISNLCRGKPQPNFELVKDTLPTLARVLRSSKDEEILTDSCWSLSYLSDDTTGTNMKIQSVIDSGVSRKLVQLLAHENVNLVVPALRAVGNLCTGDDVQTQVILNVDVLAVMPRLLTHPKRTVRKESLWCLSNISGGTGFQVHSVLTAPDVLKLVLQILADGDAEMQKEAAWVIGNAAQGGSPSDVRGLITADVIPPLCALLSVMCDPRLSLVVLEALENILRVDAEWREECDQKNAKEGSTAVDSSGPNHAVYQMESCGGRARLSRLIDEHASGEVREKANRVYDQFFGEEGEEEEEEADAPKFTFGNNSNSSEQTDKPNGHEEGNDGEGGGHSGDAGVSAAGGFSF